MNSTSLPAASSSRAADDAEVGSQKGPSQEEVVQEAYGSEVLFTFDESREPLVEASSPSLGGLQGYIRR